MPHSSTVSFLSYWRGLQTSPDKAPARERFDPAQLKSLIPQMMMIQASGPAYRFRLSGGFLVGFHGYELKDTSFVSLFRSPFRNTIESALSMGIRREQPLVLTASALWRTHSPTFNRPDDLASQSETVRFEIVLCPMANALGQVDRYVGIYQTLGTPPQNVHGTVGRYSLQSARVYEHHRLVRAAHLRLVSLEGRRIA